MGELSENVFLSCPDHSKLLCDGIWNSFQTNKLTDMLIDGNGFEIGVHRVMFGIFSTNFSPLNETDVNCNLVRPDLEQEDLSTILEFVYRGKINVVKSRLEKLKNGAAALGFRILVDAIDGYMKIQDNANNTSRNKRKLGRPIRRLIIREPSTSALSSAEEDSEEGEEEKEDDNHSFSYVPYLENATLFELEEDEEAEDDGANQLNFDNELSLTPDPTKSNCLTQPDLNPDKTVENGNEELNLEKVKYRYQASHSKPPEFSYTCSKCNFACNKKLLLTRHEHKEHSQDRPFKCDKCDYRGKTIYSLKSHAEMHSEKKFSCPVCAVKFTLSCSLNRHLKLHTSSEKPNACHLCPNRYKRLWDLKVHLRHVHNVEPPETPKCFPTKPRAARPSKKYSCPECDYDCWDHVRYINHLAVRHHLDQQKNRIEPKQKCDHCDFVCFTKSQLIAHSDRTHSDKTYSCAECDFVSSRKSNLNLHVLRKHTDKKIYMCETCGFQCATQRFLSRHQESHQGNQYICGVCDMKFALRSSLKKHGKLHISDDKPYSCHLCPYKTRKRYNVKLHLKRVHNVDPVPNKPSGSVVQHVL